MFEDLREALRSFVSGFDPESLDGAAAKGLVEELAEVERLAFAGRALAAGRVAATGAWNADGGAFRDAGAWMASVTGTTVGRARATIETASRLAALPKTAAALRSGALSDVQVDVISAAATADPDAERRLLACAATQGVKGLKDRCAQVVAAASTDQAERYEWVRAGRYLQHRALSDVEGLLEMRGPLDVTAAVMAALEPYETEIFGEARSAERRELPEAYAFDAMAQLTDDAAAGRFAECGSRAPATLVLRVDYSAYIRGRTESGEVCRIDGVGPVPVSVARKVSSDAILKAVVVDGSDVVAVSHLGRTIPARLRTAIEELYPECCIEGCHVNRHLEIDHNVPHAEGGPTSLGNLTRLCRFHHDYKHAHDSRIEGKGTDRHFAPAPRSRPRRPPPGPKPAAKAAARC